MVKVLVNGVEEKHVGRVWSALTVNEKYAIYTQSSIAEDYLNRYPNFFKLVSRSLLYKNTCKCVTNPTMQSCVDIILNGIHHYMK